MVVLEDSQRNYLVVIMWCSVGIFFHTRSIHAGYESLPVSNVRTGISVYKPDSSVKIPFISGISHFPYRTVRLGKQLSQTELKRHL